MLQRLRQTPNLYLVAVVALAGLAGAAAAAFGGGGWPALPLWLAVPAIVAMGRWPIEVDSRTDGVIIGLEPAVVIFVAFVVPDRPASLVWVVGAVATYLSARKNLWTRIFNVASASTAGIAAIAVISSLNGPIHDGPWSLAAVVVGGATYLAVDMTLSSIATLLLDRATLRSVLRPPNLPIASACFACVVALGYLAAVVGRHAPWATPMVVFPLVALCGATRAVRRTRVDRARSMALFEMSNAAQRAGTEAEILAALDRHGRDALRSPGVRLDGAAPDGSLAVVLAGDERRLVAEPRNTGEPYDDDDRRGAELLASLVTESLQRLRLLQELDDLARIDPLTGLLNRGAWHRQFDELLVAARVQPQPMVLLFCDLDRFKEVNDRHGHAAGDRVLAAVGARIAGCLRPGDLAARLGGDEFAVALLGDGGELAERIAARVRSALGEAVAVDGVAVGVSASVGTIAVDLAEPGLSSEDLLSRADAAMYAAKRADAAALRV